MVCALKCEAQAVIEEFNMKPYSQATLFDIFIDPDCNLSLTLSGVGKISSASAVIYTAMIFNNHQNHAWLNFGIAGHDFHKPGTAVLANKVTDNASGNTWYPQILFESNCENEPLITIDKPSCEYQGSAMYDMEATGFYEAVNRFSTLELTLCLKFISDNNQEDIKHINKKYVTGLIRENLETILIIIKELNRLSSIPEPGVYDENFFLDLTSMHHFTHSQKLQLIKLLKRCQVLQVNKLDNMSELSGLKNSSEIISHFNKKLTEHSYRL